jgi:hypothetical protein
MIRCSQAPTDVEVCALSVRNAFEINLIVRYVSENRENAVHWMQVRIKEEADILRSGLKFGDGGESDPRAAPIRQRLEYLEEYLAVRGATTPKPLPRWAALAERYRLDDEYRGLYGLYSKYVHPSAWTLVKPDNSWDPLFTTIFVVHLQVYAYSTATRAADTLGINSQVLESGAWSKMK